MTTSSIFLGILGLLPFASSKLSYEGRESLKAIPVAHFQAISAILIFFVAKCSSDKVFVYFEESFSFERSIGFISSKGDSTSEVPAIDLWSCAILIRSS